MSRIPHILLKISPKWHPWLGTLASISLLLCLVKPIFKDYLTRPNSMVYSMGGDALMLYYNTAFHTRYDEGSMLRSMNYPDGEYIYLTDAQGALSNTLQWINRHVTDISDCTVGFVNGFNLYLLFFAVVLLYFLLRALKVGQFAAILFAPLILLLSPQIWRMGGHFGLAYPFLIPMVMLWFLRKYKLSRLEKRDALVLATLLFFTYNNPYMGANAGLFLIFAGGLWFAAAGFPWKNGQGPIMVSGMGLLTLTIVYLDFKLLDPVPDRIHPQWGFFEYHATLEGLFYPPHSILQDGLSRFKTMPGELNYETMLNLGVVTVSALFMILIFRIIGLLRKQKFGFQGIAPEHSILLGGSFLLFLLAANTSLISIPEDWLEQNMGPLLMFKASGRLAWTLYFALSITAIVFLDRFFRTILPWFWAGLVLVLLAAVWNAEINQYTRPRFKQVFNENWFSRQKDEEMLEVLRQNQINPADYQAILCLPKMMAWSDKVLSHINFRTQVYSTRLSLATGLPMVNAMLSRIGLQHTLERVQMHSNPLVERTLLQKFPNKKDLLLLAGSDVIPELEGGDQFLVNISQRVAETKNYSLYRLHLADLTQNSELKRAKTAYQSGVFPKPVFHLNYDESASSHAFYGQGSHETKALEEPIAEFVSPFERDTQMFFSAWTYLDSGPWSAGFWLLKVSDQSGSELQNIKLETRKSNDTQDSWLRASCQLNLPKGARIQINTYGEKPLIIDELMLWPAGLSPMVDDPNAGTFLFENFKVKK